ncbi:hypothetical protein [Methylobacillus sp.]|uniref:hypothetical protein n=1 Tax=Methylobacillus sp. TaxID=56818 RepID=UPI002FDF221A
MGVFKNVLKKVALAAVVIAGKRILNKVVSDVMDGDKQPAEEKTVVVTDKPKAASGNRRRASAKSRTTGSRTTAIAKKETETAADDKPKKPAKPRSRKPRAAAKPKTAETKAVGTESQVDAVAEQQPAAMENTSSPEVGAGEASNR